jgi:hypothetical protein
MEEAIAGSPGWSETGGPWVKPNEGMKKYVWSEIEVEGGKPFQRPAPASTREHRRIPEHGQPRHDLRRRPGQRPCLLRRQRRCRLPATRYRHRHRILQPKITVNSGTQSTPPLSTMATTSTASKFLPPPSVKPHGSSTNFPSQPPFRPVTLRRGGGFDPMTMFRGFGESGRELEASDDGQTFRPIVPIENGAWAQPPRLRPSPHASSGSPSRRSHRLTMRWTISTSPA